MHGIEQSSDTDYVSMLPLDSSLILYQQYIERRFTCGAIFTYMGSRRRFNGRYMSID